MDYNDGHIHDLRLFSEDEKKKMIHDFSEGSIQLERFLLTCNNYGIYTDGCCMGHEDKGSLPYVTMIYDENDEKFNEFGKYYVNQLVNYIQFDMDESLKKEVQLDIEYSNNKNKVTIFFSNTKLADIMWYFFSQLRLNLLEPVNEDLKCVFDICKCFKELDLNFFFSENDDKKDICISEPNHLYFRDDDMKSLSFNIERLKNCEGCLKGYYKCDSQMLKEFCTELYKLYGFLVVETKKTI